MCAENIRINLLLMRMLFMVNDSPWIVLVFQFYSILSLGGHYTGADCQLGNWKTLHHEIKNVLRDRGLDLAQSTRLWLSRWNGWNSRNRIPQQANEKSSVPENQTRPGWWWTRSYNFFAVRFSNVAWPNAIRCTEYRLHQERRIGYFRFRWIRPTGQSIQTNMLLIDRIS